ncbi:MAG: fumarylacetoacetate hydrolase family protein [Actinomycetota bacterium]|nr:fumarylacetoacetate hydrolase family protein [Actinomycetota bacterium]MDG1489118.1 fumarylacetoacetate hydrolase family protein [Actinomycetota bacterium]
MSIPLAVSLAHARMAMQSLSLDDVTVPNSASSSYAIQDELISLLASPQIGWKVGATGQASQQKLGVKTPLVGPVFDTTLFNAGATIPLTGFHHRPGIESEIAFKIATTLRPGGKSMNAVSVRGIVSAAYPAIELVCTRFETNFAVPPALLVADGVAHAGLILGDEVPASKLGDLSQLSISTLINGTKVSSGTGAEVLGDPFESLAWLCNHLSGRGIELPQGSIVTTGACTGINESQTNALVATDAGPLGTVSIQLSE